MAMIGGANPLGLSFGAFADIALMAVFTFGVYKNSRVCAILMLVLFVLNKALMWAENGQISGVPVALVFLWFYVQGVIGTFQHHKVLAAQPGPY